MDELLTIERSFVILRASALGLLYAKCKAHLAYKPKKRQQREGHMLKC